MICGTPTFGRTAADVIEVSAPPVGWTGECGGTNQPNFVGPFVTTAPVLTPPPTNGKLKTIAGATYTRNCLTNITLSGNNMTVQVGTGSPSTFPIPADGVFYVGNGNSTCSTNVCSGSYSPFTATYPTASQCGNAVVRGTYSGPADDRGRERHHRRRQHHQDSGNGLLGLVANNFVRVKHPFSAQTERRQLQRG